MRRELPSTANSERQPIILNLDSRGSCELTLADLLEDGKLEVLPHVEKSGLLFLQFRKNQVTLSAGPFVGLIPLTPRIIVEVRPKLPVGNLARVLDTARASLRSISGSDRNYLTDQSYSSSVIEFIASNLIDAVKKVILGGFHKTYVGVSHASSQPRGRMDIVGTVRHCWTRGNRHQLLTRRFEQTADNAPNRVLKSAIELILVRGCIWFDQKSSILKEANSLYLDLPKGIERLTPGDVEHCEAIIERKQLPEFRQQYYRALEISLLLLSGQSISLKERGEDITLGTYIINFEHLFEAYLRRCLQHRSEERFWVRDGNREARKPLFDDQKDPPAQPDIVIIDRESRKALVVEIKYKDRPSRDDINQAITYALSYRTCRAVLVHQLKPGSAPGLRKLGTINGIQLYAYAFDLGREDLIAEEAALTNCLFELAKAA